MVTEEIKQQPPPLAVEKELIEATHLRYPTGIYSSPIYAKITRKKNPESSRSLKDESFERPSKHFGRKSHREAQEEEAKRQKM